MKGLTVERVAFALGASVALSAFVGLLVYLVAPGWMYLVTAVVLGAVLAYWGLERVRDEAQVARDRKSTGPVRPIDVDESPGL